MKKRSPADPCARADENPGNYDSHARALHNRAKQAYATWLASASPEEREKIRNMGVETPPDDNNEVGGHSPYSLSDIADSPLAKCDPIIATDEPEDTMADEFGISPEIARKILSWHSFQIDIAVQQEKANYLQIIVGGLLSSKNPKLNAAGLAFAANLAALNGLPCQREFARQNHISASAISKVVRAWSKALDLRPSAHQKTNEACEVYSHIGKQGHWRSKKVSSASASELLRKLRKTNPLQN